VAKMPSLPVFWLHLSCGYLLWEGISCTPKPLERGRLAVCLKLELGRMPEALDLVQPARQWVPFRENLANSFLRCPVHNWRPRNCSNP
jgi:hypothetical protein